MTQRQWGTAVLLEEDAGFHVVLTVVMVGLASLAWWVARAVRSRREVAA